MIYLIFMIGVIHYVTNYISLNYDLFDFYDWCDSHVMNHTHHKNQINHS